MKLVTVADYFEAKFGELARRLAVVSCLLFVIGALVAQFAAMGTITESVLALDYRMAVVVGGAIVVFYSTIGGIGAVVKTDVLQFVILVTGIGVASGYLVYHQGGLAKMAAVAGHVDSAVFFADMTDLFGPESRVRIITLFCAFFLGELLVPTYAVRCFIARDARSAQWGVAGAGIFLLLFMPMATYVMGVAARSDPAVKAKVTRAFDDQVARAQSDTEQDPSADQRQSLQNQSASAAAQIAFPTLIRSAFHPLFSGIMIAAVIAAVMSSADSCLSCLGTIVMEDIYRPHIKPSASDKEMLKVAQWTTLVTGILTATCACVYRDIVGILEFVYDFWAPTMVIPFLYGLFFYRRSQIPAVVTSMLTGLTATVVWKWGYGSPAGFSPALFGFLIALATVLLMLPFAKRLPSFRLLLPKQRSVTDTHLNGGCDA
jgi:SSS family solute:Na+ symporter